MPRNKIRTQVLAALATDPSGRPLTETIGGGGGGGGAVVWGGIGGTLSNQADLNAALAARLAKSGWTPGSLFVANAAGTIVAEVTNLFWDATNNRLGIGTATPQAPLHVTGVIASGNADVSRGAFTHEVVGGGLHGKLHLQSNRGAGLVTGATLDHSGQFGVGTTTPQAPLHVTGVIASGNVDVPRAGFTHEVVGAGVHGKFHMQSNQGAGLVTGATLDHSGHFSVASVTSRHRNAVVQETTVVGTQNDFSLTGAHTYLRCNPASPVTFTGFAVAGAAPLDGDEVIIDNVGSSTVKVTDEGAGSTASRRCLTPSAAGQIIGRRGRMHAIWEAPSSRWRVQVIDPGEFIAVAHSAGDYTGNGAMTWTVEAVDLVSFGYQQRGRAVTVMFYILGTTVGGTPSSQLRIALPGGFVSTSASLSIIAVSDNGVSLAGFADVAAAGTQIRCARIDATSWALSTGNTAVYGTVIVGVN